LLHLEFLQGDFAGELLIAPHSDADLLVLASDIASGMQVIDLYVHWPVPVLYVIWSLLLGPLQYGDSCGRTANLELHLRRCLYRAEVRTARHRLPSLTALGQPKLASHDQDEFEDGIRSFIE